MISTRHSVDLTFAGVHILGFEWMMGIPGKKRYRSWNASCCARVKGKFYDGIADEASRLVAGHDAVIGVFNPGSGN